MSQRQFIIRLLCCCHFYMRWYSPGVKNQEQGYYLLLAVLFNVFLNEQHWMFRKGNLHDNKVHSYELKNPLMSYIGAIQFIVYILLVFRIKYIYNEPHVNFFW